MSGLRLADDGAKRCWWCGDDPLYVGYHDSEWGWPDIDDQRLYEKICLEGFQAGLSWITILRRREAFRAAFSGFQMEAVAAFDEHDVERLMGDAAIIRNRAKIRSAIVNAQATLDLHARGETLVELVWGVEPGRRSRPAPAKAADLPAVTPESTTLAKTLKARGFTFMGPTTSYALMQSAGVVNDHLRGCVTRSPAEQARQALGRRVA